jgi:hypothetical protein
VLIYFDLLMQVAILGACHCGIDPCECAVVATKLAQDVTRLTDEVSSYYFNNVFFYECCTCLQIHLHNMRLKKCSVCKSSVAGKSTVFGVNCVHPVSC